MFEWLLGNVLGGALGGSGRARQVEGQQRALQGLIDRQREIPYYAKKAKREAQARFGNFDEVIDIKPVVKQLGDTKERVLNREILDLKQENWAMGEKNQELTKLVEEGAGLMTGLLDDMDKMEKENKELKDENQKYKGLVFVLRNDRRGWGGKCGEDSTACL